MTRRHLIVLALALFTLPLVASESSKKYFGGIDLVDQNGKPENLAKLMEGRTIVVNTIFTSCDASCPIMEKTFATIQDHYASQMGKELVLVSISVDPANDTPQALKAYASKVKAKDGWYFLTGTKEQVDYALKRFGVPAEKREMHSNLMFAGNDKTGLWKKIHGMAKADEIVAAVDSVLRDQGQAKAQ
jgi:protein SCO1/2